ncbi:Pyruvate dehydrogenase [NADP(+)], mitochondrial [Frankliniella fusca]|uniref:Pyruvate dehydrogenase [NADP(+)], mitochondrial n=1 Tax=Frankliniella fusca TaxID=407009 RepID=A0AAE1LEC7_9NEOP|nr:Pyruvate dehydrogenase [NADP(+)], mitochondrial [Frankliniella fusca]
MSCKNQTPIHTSFLLQYHRGIPVEDHSDTSLGSYQCDRKPLPASGAGGCFPVGPDHIQVQAGTILICAWLPASLGVRGKPVLWQHIRGILCLFLSRSPLGVGILAPVAWLALCQIFHHGLLRGLWANLPDFPESSRSIRSS